MSSRQKTMPEIECTTFLQWALPKMGMRWPGFRKPRRQVCRRIKRRMADLGIESFADYRRVLEVERVEATEWRILDSLCRVTISRYFRDRAVWDFLDREVLPRLARDVEAVGREAVSAWSAGCASGEEPHSLGLVWRLGTQKTGSVGLVVVATDTDESLLSRAARAAYPGSSLRELPEAWQAEAFRPVDGGLLELREPFRRGIEFRRADIRRASPDGPFDLVLCRNLAWTYFDLAVQLGVLERIRSVLRPGGFLVIGGHEELPAQGEGFEWLARCVFRAEP